MLSQITLVYNLQSQYIFNDLPRKLQSEFMEKIYEFNRWPSKNDLSRTIQFINYTISKTSTFTLFTFSRKA